MSQPEVLGEFILHNSMHTLVFVNPIPMQPTSPKHHGLNHNLDLTNPSPW